MRTDRPGYVVRFSHEGRRIARSAGKSWAEADKKRRAARALVEAGVSLDDVLASVFGDVGGSGLTFRDAAPLYLEYASQRKKPSTLRSDVHRLRGLCKATWAARPLAAIEPRQLRNWMDKRRRSGVSGATLNRDMSLGSALYRWAAEAGHVEGNPFRKIRRDSEKGRARETYLTAEEAQALLASCSDVLRPFVLAALHTACRRGELLGLRWRAVDLARREILIEPAAEKTGRGRVVPMTSELHAELCRLKSERPRPAIDGSDQVFAGSTGRPLQPRTLSTMVRTTVDRCEGIPLEKREGVTLHVLRHTAASLMVAAGVPLFDVAKILGHSTLAVTMRYAHFAPEAGRAAIESLGGALSTSKKGRRKAL